MPDRRWGPTHSRWSRAISEHGPKVRIGHASGVSRARVFFSLSLSLSKKKTHTQDHHSRFSSPVRVPRWVCGKREMAQAAALLRKQLGKVSDVKPAEQAGRRRFKNSNTSRSFPVSDFGRAKQCSEEPQDTCASFEFSIVSSPLDRISHFSTSRLVSPNAGGHRHRAAGRGPRDGVERSGTKGFCLPRPVCGTRPARVSLGIRAPERAAAALERETRSFFIVAALVRRQQRPPFSTGRERPPRGLLENRSLAGLGVLAEERTRWPLFFSSFFPEKTRAALLREERLFWGGRNLPPNGSTRLTEFHRSLSVVETVSDEDDRHLENDVHGPWQSPRTLSIVAKSETGNSRLEILEFGKNDTRTSRYCHLGAFRGLHSSRVAECVSVALNARVSPPARPVHFLLLVPRSFPVRLAHIEGVLESHRTRTIRLDHLRSSSDTVSTTLRTQNTPPTGRARLLPEPRRPPECVRVFESGCETWTRGRPECVREALVCGPLDFRTLSKVRTWPRRCHRSRRFLGDYSPNERSLARPAERRVTGERALRHRRARAPSVLVVVAAREFAALDARGESRSQASSSARWRPLPLSWFSSERRVPDWSAVGSRGQREGE